jgi:hypothetical protein
MRCAMAMVLAAGLGFGAYGCTQAQRAAATQGAVDGAGEQAPVPPTGYSWDQFALYYLAYLAGSVTKKGMGIAKDKFLKPSA